MKFLKLHSEHHLEDFLLFLKIIEGHRFCSCFLKSNQNQIEPEDEIESALSNYRMIENELKAYGHGLNEKPMIEVISKVDLAYNEDVIAKVSDTIMREAGLDKPPLAISSITGRGLKELVSMISDMFKEDEDRWPESHITDLLFDEHDV